MCVYFINTPITPRLKARFTQLNKVSTQDCKEVEFIEDVDPEDCTGIVFSPEASHDLLCEYREKRIPCMINTQDTNTIDKYIIKTKVGVTAKAERFSYDGWEVTSQGDIRFSPFFAQIKVENKKWSMENYYQLIIKGGKFLGATGWRDMKGIPPLRIEITSSPWTRDSVARDKESLYIFTDNLLRTSGNNPIDPESWYVKKYTGSFICCDHIMLPNNFKYPTKSQAVIRGLDNAFPITTMEDCHLSQLSDCTAYNIKDIWSDEINAIRAAYLTGKYRRIVISNCEFGNGTYSRIKSNEPLLYRYLYRKLFSLGIINEPSVRVVESLTMDINTQVKNMYIWFLEQNPELLVELIEIARKHTLTDRFWVPGTSSQAYYYKEILNEHFTL